MKRVLRFAAVLAAIVLIASCSLDSLFTKKADIRISNPSDASVDVKCVYFTGPQTITIPAHGSRTAEVEVYDDNTEITLFTDGRFYEYSNSKVRFRSSGMSVTLEPDVSWIAVHNSTGSTLKYVAFNDISPSSIGGNYCYWDSFGNLTGDSTLIPGETRYIQFKQSSYDCGVSGWITCSVGMYNYATTMTVRSPSAGSENDVYLYSSSLRRNSLI